MTLIKATVKRERNKKTEVKAIEQQWEMQMGRNDRIKTQGAYHRPTVDHYSGKALQSGELDLFCWGIFQKLTPAS